jgi:DNA-binding CsgD family transcriptional regulator
MKRSNSENSAMCQKRALMERVKELNCLYSLSSTFRKKELTLDEVMQALISIISLAWQFEDIVSVRLLYDGKDFHSPNFRHTKWCLKSDLQVSGKRFGFVEVCYLKEVPGGEKNCFLAAEKKLIRSIAELVGNHIEQRKYQQELKETAEELEFQKKELERKNIALREVLDQIEYEKKEIKDQIALNLALLVVPYIKKLSTGRISLEKQREYLKIVQNNIEHISSSFFRQVIQKKVRLSPREVEVCTMIKNGFTNKEISDLLNISITTVERHRFNIRKKLGIVNKKINLTTYILSDETSF